MSERERAESETTEGVDSGLAEDRDDLGRLMQAEEVEHDRTRQARVAVAEAESALRAARAALAEAESISLAPRPALTAPRLVLTGLLAAIAITVAWPRTPVAPATPLRFAEPVVDPRLVLPVDARYDAALVAARNGDYARAATLMKTYVESHDELHPSLAYGPKMLLGRFLRLSERVAEAVAVETRARRAVGAEPVSEALWRAVWDARAGGDATALRRACAELLLHGPALTPTQLAVVTEACLELESR